jgi:acyl carrier protein
MPDKRVAEALGRLMGIPVDGLTGDIPTPSADLRSADSLDTIELITELEEEFDEDTIRWALR